CCVRWGIHIDPVGPKMKSRIIQNSCDAVELCNKFLRENSAGGMPAADPAVTFEKMQKIAPARLRPGARLPQGDPNVGSSEPQAAGSRVIRGRALIFWDPKLPGTKFGKKLDAIDTDQITP